MKLKHLFRPKLNALPFGHHNLIMSESHIAAMLLVHGIWPIFHRAVGTRKWDMDRVVGTLSMGHGLSCRNMEYEKWIELL